MKGEGLVAFMLAKVINSNQELTGQLTFVFLTHVHTCICGPAGLDMRLKVFIAYMLWRQRKINIFDQISMLH